MKVSLPAIQDDRTGFEALINLHSSTRECFFESMEVDMGTCNWFAAHMCAAFGAILYRLGDNMNSITLTNLQPNVEKILSKNGFLSNYGRERIPDTWETTIPYRRFDAKDHRSFADYIERDFVMRPEMPAMSPGLLKRICESMLEIFSNSVIHSRTQLGIFSCGQYFPKLNRLHFSIADLGIGIRQNVKEHIGIDLAADEAIHWATTGRNTTRTGPVPGGLGLKLLKEFISLNGGRIQIVSDAGHWCLEDRETSTARLTMPFPGTVVNIEINTSDTQSYMLSSELRESDIL